MVQTTEPIRALPDAYLLVNRLDPVQSYNYNSCLGWFITFGVRGTCCTFHCIYLLNYQWMKSEKEAHIHWTQIFLHFHKNQQIFKCSSSMIQHLCYYIDYRQDILCGLWVPSLSLTPPPRWKQNYYWLLVQSKGFHHWENCRTFLRWSSKFSRIGFLHRLGSRSNIPPRTSCENVGC